MTVPESENPSSPAPPAQTDSPIFVETTDGYRVDWERLVRFHVNASKDASRPAVRRAWHAKQARLIRSRHTFVETNCWSWAAHCQQAMEASQ